MNKKTKNVLIVLGLITFTVGLFWLILFSGVIGSEKEAIGYSQSVLSASEDTFDFGTLEMKNGKVQHDYIATNDGPEPLVIQKVYTSCACTSAYIIDSANKKHGDFGMPGHIGSAKKANITVNPGESITVVAVYDPAAHGPAGVGIADRSIYLETNSSTSPKLELKFRAVVTN